jgi:hypothetical protein
MGTLPDAKETGGASGIYARSDGPQWGGARIEGAPPRIESAAAPAQMRGDRVRMANSILAAAVVMFIADLTRKRRAGKRERFANARIFDAQPSP